MDICKTRVRKPTQEEAHGFAKGEVAKTLGKVLLRTAFWVTHNDSTAAENIQNPKIGGSAVCVKGAWGQGVVTAGHCLHEVEKGRCMSLMTSTGPGPRSEQMRAVLVHEKMLRQAVVCPNRRKRREGPDIAFVPLSRQTMQEMEDQGSAVFLNMDRQEEKNAEKLKGQMITYQAVGHVELDGKEVEKVRPSPRGEGSLVTRCLGVQRGGRCRYASGWDYVPLKCVTHKGEETELYPLGDETPRWIMMLSVTEPESWRGMSGSGLWWIAQDAHGRTTFGLCGIIFCEYKTQVRKELRLYAHGRESVSRILQEAKGTEIDYSNPIVKVRPR